MKPWVETAISLLLRTGVLLSVLIVAVGLVITFAHHPDYFSSRPALGQLTSARAHFPNTLREVIDGIRQAHGQAIIMAGLLVLIATPVARVALSLVIFLIERDRLFVAITTAVLMILIFSFAVGLSA